jgi:hypothetical protein
MITSKCAVVSGVPSVVEAEQMIDNRLSTKKIHPKAKKLRFQDDGSEQSRLREKMLVEVKPYAIECCQHGLLIQINPHREQVSPKQSHDRRIRGARRQLTRKPALPLARIIARKQMCRAGTLASAEPFAQL